MRKAAPRVVIVVLRRPRRSNLVEQRSDPFYEFGNFGCTGCHSSNVLHPDRADELHGVRLAFAQGGDAGFRLVLLTPPVRIKRRGMLAEAVWKPRTPFKYESAPVLARGRATSDFPLLRSSIRGTRTTAEGRFASAFRSRRQPLPPAVAEEVCEVYDNSHSLASRDDLASAYWQTLPYAPPQPDLDRRATLRKLRALAGDDLPERQLLREVARLCRGRC